ncbi:hypothetical protein OO013_09585 [Mangrovivirga sp. M17]|uniref:Peptidase C39-like domain-containing protein n=1 Tax=Mangrovivirga halotolerans TaxID=2993936 RepID=A0ABT3RRA8_9BACT|nr:papain-like cysteine protease family protein [Mangrovivirga halotolerans]MCX2744117.1 hypothetical protein [Mangrovivirga halotolerans]
MKYLLKMLALMLLYTSCGEKADTKQLPFLKESSIDQNPCVKCTQEIQMELAKCLNSARSDQSKIDECNKKASEKWTSKCKDICSPSIVKSSSVRVDYEVSSVPAIKQPYSMACWATAYTMLYSWKKKQSFTILDALSRFPSSNNYVKIFRENKGINEVEEQKFYDLVGLNVIQGLNPSIKGWFSLLKENGPLSITVDSNPPLGTIHALVIIGINGDGSDKTKIKYIDPGDGGVHEVSFSKFISLYEGSSKWSNQIIHY